MIRSHGVERDLRADRRKRAECVDATCPFVKKIHKIVERESKMAGRSLSSETRLTRRWKGSKAGVSKVTVIGNAEEAEKSANSDERICIVSQTTFNYKKFKELVEILSKKRYDILVLNTICNATEERQQEARQIAAEVDAMIVIGGKHSSNTQKLFEICKEECQEYLLYTDT